MKISSPKPHEESTLTDNGDGTVNVTSFLHVRRLFFLVNTLADCRWENK